MSWMPLERGDFFWFGKRLIEIEWPRFGRGLSMIWECDPATTERTRFLQNLPKSELTGVGL